MQASRCILWQLTFDLREISSCDPRVAIFQSLNQPWAGHVEVMPRFGGQNLGQTESSPEQPHLQMCRKGYPLVNVYRKLWKDPPFSMGKSTISTGSFSIANCWHNPRVYLVIPGYTSVIGPAVPFCSARIGTNRHCLVSPKLWRTAGMLVLNAFLKPWVTIEHILVGDLEPWNFMTFHILGRILPTDEVIFFRGVETIN